jgi:alkylhydroperoxidase family enzyme
MARIQGIDPSKAPFLIRRALAYSKKLFGKDLTPSKISARVPKVFWGAALLEMTIAKSSGITPRQRSLVQLRTSSLVGCSF